jgi:hypothetical protein
MEKYKKIIGKKIDNMNNGRRFNSFVITELSPSLEKVNGFDKMFLGVVTWEDKKHVPERAQEKMLFDEKTLDDLAEKGMAVCPIPFLQNMYYVIAE